MEYQTKEIKKGIKLHYIKTDLFKTDLISVFISRKLNRETITKNTLIPAVLTSGTKTMPTQEEINKKMEELYGAEMDCGIEKVGDNQLLKFYIESINNNYVLNNENLIEEVINKLFEIIFEPVLENGVFKKEYVEKEKVKIKQLIEGKIDNKDKYALDRMTEEMYKGELYGLYKYGYVEDLEKITPEDLYKTYINLLENAKIDIVVSGDFNQEAIEKIITENENIKNLKERTPDYVVNSINIKTSKSENLTTSTNTNVNTSTATNTTQKDSNQENVVEESLNVAQGKLVMGLDVLENEENSKYILGMYSTILGGSAMSKLFQNVREKESLAYSIGSLYLKQKNNIIIKAGIEIENYEKAVNLIKNEIEDMKKGNFEEKDVEQAKQFIIHGINSIVEDQETGVNYYISQEFLNTSVTPEEYIEKINNVTKDEIVQIAQKIRINTIYFLRN